MEVLVLTARRRRRQRPRIPSAAMKRPLSLLLLTVLLVGCGKKIKSVPPADPRIVGSWSVVNGDYPLTNIYRSDGTMVQHLSGGETDPSAYRIEGDQLIITIETKGEPPSEQKMRYSISGDVLTLYYSADVKMQYQRVK